MSSRRASRNGSINARSSNEEEEIELTGDPDGMRSVESRQRSRVDIVSYGRRSSEEGKGGSDQDSRGITVTTTWNVNVRTAEEPDPDSADDEDIIHLDQYVHGSPRETGVVFALDME